MHICMHMCRMCVVKSSTHDNKASTSPTELSHHPNVQLFVFKTEPH